MPANNVGGSLTLFFGKKKAWRVCPPGYVAQEAQTVYLYEQSESRHFVHASRRDVCDSRSDVWTGESQANSRVLFMDNPI